ncbi:MAG: RNA 2',3'-cyclic phosphodiesterase [Proteobacteria bacterium]|nr:RNA 2',3'-cyclic phosphodiesterase [Pseudomonadota bacterium]
MPETFRAFIAVSLPAEIRAVLGRMRDRFMSSGLDVRCVSPESMHLTLKFLGDVGKGRGPEILAAMERAVAGVRPFPLSVRGAGVFPGFSNPRVVWVGLAGDFQPLAGLAARLEEELSALGFAPEARRFSPHITLGRARVKLPMDRTLKAVESLADMGSEPFFVDRLTLYRSELSPQGARHTPSFSAVFTG